MLPSSTGPSARTARSRACSSSQTSRTSARACCFGALHGQGPLQGGDARRRDPGRALDHAAPRRRGREPVRLPVFVKPARLGSSVGISKALDEDELARAVELARRHDDKVLVEEFVPGMEVECGVLGNRGRRSRRFRRDRRARRDWYDYSAKYDEGGMDLSSRRRLADETVERVQAARAPRLRRDRVRGHGPRRLLRPRRRRGAPQRAEHDPRLHLDERLREAVRGLGDPVRRAARPADRARARPARAPLTLATSSLVCSACQSRPIASKSPGAARSASGSPFRAMPRARTANGCSMCPRPGGAVHASCSLATTAEAGAPSKRVLRTER